VITERQTRLTRAPTLQAFRAALADLIPTRDVARARATSVIVPTRSAAELLRRTLEDRLTARGDALVLPDLVTRRDWYELLHQRSPGLPPLLTQLEREVLVEGAAHEAITEGDTPPFHLRPALVGEILSLYDALRRHQRTVARFEELLTESFEAAAGYDRGAERLLRQTRFLARTLRGYERRLADLGHLDEHLLRDSLLTVEPARPYKAIVVAVGDDAHDPGGLWRADFHLLTRLPGLETIDLVATEEQLATGLLERLHDLLPGLDEVRVSPPAGQLDAPVLVVPPDDGQHSARFSSRDREEELNDLVRRIRALAGSRPELPLDRIGIVVGRPLPYVYLAREVFRSGGVPLETRDSLPLAAEPFAAALDLVFSATSTGCAAGPLTSLLRSPHFAFGADAAGLSPRDVAALEVGLAAFDFGGDADRLESLAAAWLGGAVSPPRDPRWDREGASRAARAAAEVVRALEGVIQQGPASRALAALLTFLNRFTRPVAPADPLAERELRARRTVVALLDGLAEAFRRHHDPLWTAEELAATVRRWIEGETFTVAAPERGVLLVDRAAAPFGDFADLHIAGLVEGEWPAHPRRNVFYSNALLAGLGWPRDPDRSAAVRAAFVDLLQSARARVSLSLFALEDDALVEPSSLLALAARAGLSEVSLTVPGRLVFAHEALGMRPVPDVGVPEPARSWAALRASRPDLSAPEFHGQAAPPAPRAWSVSAVDLYGQCPFKFFARHVLRLGEERPDEEGLTPLERGRLIHEVFERFYADWQSRGHRTVTTDDLDEARAMAEAVLDSHLGSLLPSDAALERTRFLGSPIAQGLIDVVLRMEAERGEAVVERWLEHRLDGTIHLRSPDGPRDVEIRGIADRVDLLADGTFRVIDYKSSRASGPLQLAIYAAALRQRLADYRGRAWALGEAAYVAFREDPPTRPLARTSGDLEEVLEQQEARFVTLVDGIGRGEFPPRPAQRSLCATCAWASVCRKDYVEADEPSPAV
jgi:RecB family exonuclease